MPINAFRTFLARLAERYGKPVVWLYALVFLLLATGVLSLVYLFFGVLTAVSPDAVLIVTALLVILIFYTNRRKP